MKILLVYFSATGNTKFYSSLLAAKLKKTGHECELVDIEKSFNAPSLWRERPVIQPYMLEADRRVKMFAPAGCSGGPIQQDNSASLISFAQKASQFDLIGFGSPVYFFRAAPVMESFIKLMPSLRGMTAFTYGTHMEGPIAFAENFKSVLSEKVKVIGHVDDYIMHTEMVPAIAEFMAKQPYLERYFRYRMPTINYKMEKFIKKIGLGCMPGSLSPFETPPADAISKFIGKAVEQGLYLLFPYAIGNRTIKSRCVKCMQCVKNCPIGLIKEAPDGYPLRDSHCMYCLRCINSCPTNAIIFTGYYKNTARFRGFSKLTQDGFGA